MEATTYAFDFYSYIHKSLRRQLLEAVTGAGALDFTDVASVMSFGESFQRVLKNLHAHGQHEDTFLHPVLSRHLADAAARFGDAHGKQHAWMDALEKQFADAAHAHSPQLGADFCRELGRFAGYYLVHLAEEEDLNPQINAEAPHEELAAAMAAFQASRTPEEAARDLEIMLPVLNRQDRYAILERLKVKAPPVFIFVMDIARRVLDIRTLTGLENDLGVGSTG